MRRVDAVVAALARRTRADDDLKVVLRRLRGSEVLPQREIGLNDALEHSAFVPDAVCGDDATHVLYHSVADVHGCEQCATQQRWEEVGCEVGNRHQHLSSRTSAEDKAAVLAKIDLLAQCSSVGQAVQLAGALGLQLPDKRRRGRARPVRKRSCNSG